MNNLLMLATAIGLTAFTAKTLLTWIAGGEDGLPGEWGNPWLDLELSEVSFERDDGCLVVAVALSEFEVRQCIQIVSKRAGDTIHILVQRADSPKGMMQKMYSPTDESGRYSCSISLEKGINSILCPS